MSIIEYRAARVSPNALRQAIQDGLPIHPSRRARGIGWIGRTTDNSPTRTVACFSPVAPGTTITPVARVLVFEPMSRIGVIARPRHVHLLLGVDDSAALYAFGRRVWRFSADPCFREAAEQSPFALVLIVDSPAPPGANPVVGVAPENIWAGHVPVRCGITPDSAA